MRFNGKEGIGSNPSKATSQPFLDGFEPLKTGVFEPDFNGVAFETLFTILCLCNEAWPDIEKTDSEREEFPLSSTKRGNLGSSEPLSREVPIL